MYLSILSRRKGEHWILTHAEEEWEMVHNGSVPHDVLHQLVQEGGMLEKGEEDLKKQARFPDLSISNDSLKTTFIKT